MDHLLRTVEPFLKHYGYFAVFAGIFLEDFGIPTPGETLLIVGALAASRASFDIFLLMLVAWSAAVLGDNVGYAIGRFGGRRLVLRFGRYVFLSESRLERAERFFETRGAVVVIVARFFEILRQANGIVAGIAGMRWWRFLLCNAAGAALWVGFWSVLFFQLGRQGERIALHIRGYEWVAGAVLAVLVAGFFIARILVRRHRQTKARAQSSLPR